MEDDTAFVLAPPRQRSQEVGRTFSMNVMADYMLFTLLYHINHRNNEFSQNGEKNALVLYLEVSMQNIKKKCKQQMLTGAS